MSRVCTSSTKFAIASAGDMGVRSYFYSNGTIQERATGGNAGSPAGYNTWSPAFNFGSLVNNVDPSSDFAAIGYISPTSRNVTIRVFYQTTDCNIRSVWWIPGGWRLDNTIIGVGLRGTCISTMQQSNNSGQEGVVVQYVDSQGSLSQRYSTNDEGNWCPVAKVL